MSFVDEPLFALFTPRGQRKPLKVEHSSRRQENILRQSLVPSLLKARRENERQGNFNAQLFEIARVYLFADPGKPEAEVKQVSFVSGRSFGELKGVVEALVDSVNHSARVNVKPCSVPQFAEGRGAEVHVDGRRLGWLGELDRSVGDRLDLRDAVTVAELDMSVLEEVAHLIPTSAELPRFPSIVRDLNFVLDEHVTWEQLKEVIGMAAGPLLDTMRFGGQYRGKQIPADKKSYVVTLHYRSPDRTLTAEEVDAAQQAVIAACADALGATLR
jgi:phenylalanyl-tRNA synthetase beta chain